MIIITPNRIKAIIAECKTDADLVANLRHHKIRYRYTTESGFLSVVIPCRTGSIRVYRTASRSNPFRIVPASVTNNYYKMLDTRSYV